VNCYISYGKVLAVVGMNPKKNYPVSPHERSDLLRKMILDSQILNVEVQGTNGSLLAVRLNHALDVSHIQYMSLDNLL
jgi:phosphopantetheine adenylyltransferase